MSASPHAPAHFDEHYALVTKPQPTIEYHLSREAAQLLVDTLNGQMVSRYIKRLAQGNDVDSLAQILAAHRNTPGAQLGQRRELRFDVAHMLIDGGGNEAFAREWMQAFYDGDREGEIELLKELFERPSTSIWADQRRLGMVSLNPFFVRDDFNSTTLLEQIMSTTTAQDFKERAPDLVRSLALILKMFHADNLPQMHQVNDEHQLALVPITDVMLGRGKAKLLYLLPAVEQAYGLDNEAARHVVQQSLHRMVDENQLVTLSFGNGADHACQWEAMEKWGAVGLAEKIPHARLGTGKSLYSQICEQNPNNFAQRVAQLNRMGVDLDLPVRIGRQSLRLIEQCVLICEPDHVGFMLGIGANPDLPMTDNPAETAVTIGLKMDQVDTKAKGTIAFDKMAAMLRSHQAKTAALSVIDEIMATPAPAPGR